MTAATGAQAISKAELICGSRCGIEPPVCLHVTFVRSWRFGPGPDLERSGVWIGHFNHPLAFVNIKVLMKQCDSEAIQRTVTSQYVSNLVEYRLVAIRVERLNFVYVEQALMLSCDGPIQIHLPLRCAVSSQNLKTIAASQPDGTHPLPRQVAQISSPT
jgi:hypothetical protein